MPGRIRNTKKLAQRVDRSYLKTLFPIPRWRRILTAGCLVVGLAWLGLYAAARNQTPYTAGELSPSHASLAGNCAACHGGSGGIGKHIADTQCAACHASVPHNAEQVSAPHCVECHEEHRGITRLAATGTAQCAACHANLRTRSGKFSVSSHVPSFENHPQFAAVRNGRDDSTLKFNHAKHAGELAQKCGDCHAPAGHIPTYALTCAPCHGLNFDDKIPDAAPHSQPALVSKFVEDSLTKYIAEHPADLGKDGAPSAPGAWVKFKADADEKQLWTVTCARCHDGLPEPPKVIVPTRWFRHGLFDHEAHRSQTCASCHPRATTSSASADLMLPGIEVCRTCHNAERISAGEDCATCHKYHSPAGTQISSLRSVR
jgi:peptide methionine sulfoxide reductase MsrB